MGKRSSQRRSAAMLDTDDSDSVSSSSTVQSENLFTSGVEEVQPDQDLLDRSLDDLFEKRGSTREKALAVIIEKFNGSLQHEFVEKKSVTLLHQCLSCIKKGSSKEIALASHVIGLLALTLGPGDKAQEISEEVATPISLSLKSGFETAKVSSLLECLAITSFIGGNEPEETERSMQLMWQVVHPKLGTNVVATKPSPGIITAMVSAWAFLLTTIDSRNLDSKSWQGSIAYLSTLLEKDDRSIRIAAGEALALIFEIGALEKFSAEAKASSDSSISKEFSHIQGLKSKILNQVRNLSVEAGGKGSIKKDLNSQRSSFRDILDFLEYGYTPESSTKIGGETLTTSSWAQLIQLNFLKHFLAGGFVKHMQENEFLHDIFGFAPKKKQLMSSEKRMSADDKRFYKSPNSVMNKARTQFRNKQRVMSQDKNAGHYAADDLD